MLFLKVSRGHGNWRYDNTSQGGKQRSGNPKREQELRPRAGPLVSAKGPENSPFEGDCGCQSGVILSTGVPCREREGQLLTVNFEFNLKEGMSGERCQEGHETVILTTTWSPEAELPRQGLLPAPSHDGRGSRWRRAPHWL